MVHVQQSSCLDWRQQVSFGRRTVRRLGRLRYQLQYSIHRGTFHASVGDLGDAEIRSSDGVLQDLLPTTAVDRDDGEKA